MVHTLTDQKADGWIISFPADQFIHGIDIIIELSCKLWFKGCNLKFDDNVTPEIDMVKKQAKGMEYLDEALIRKYGIFDPAFISKMKADYSEENFKLMGAYEIDYLMIALTVTMLCETYGLSV